MESLWTATFSPPRFEPLRGNLETDVAIVGAGIAGLTAALTLQERGLRVAVLEEETVGAGETGKITAPPRYHYIRRKHGAEEAKRVADAGRASIEKIAELVERYAIDCHFRRVPGYLYTEKRKYVAELKNEAVAAREAGIDVQWITDVPLPFETRGAVLFPNQVQFHPGEYVAALANIIVKNGGRIFERTRVRDVVVTAREIFVVKAAPWRTYAMAFDASDDHPEGLFWDTADSYHYTRRQETNAGTFLIVGGEDHRAGDNEDAEGHFASLLAYARETFRVRLPRYRWSGQVITGAVELEDAGTLARTTHQ